MQDKLQQLTERLYNEGLAKGKEEAAAMLEKAKEQAEQILASAQQQSQQMISKAEKECLEIKAKADGDIRTASQLALSQIKQDIEQAISIETVAKPVKEALSSKEFMQSLIKTIIAAYSPDKEATGLEFILPENMKADLEHYLKELIHTSLSDGLDVKFSKNVSSGFKVSRKGSGYFIDFSEEAFIDIISGYLRPKTRKLIFGE